MCRIKIYTLINQLTGNQCIADIGPVQQVVDVGTSKVDMVTIVTLCSICKQTGSE